MLFFRWAQILIIFSLLAACAASPGGDKAGPDPMPDRSVDQLPPAQEDAVRGPIPDFGPMADDQINVAVLLPFSGQGRDVGQALFNAITMAHFDAADPRIRLRPYDTRGSARDAALAVTRALEDDADIILGPLFGPAVAAAGEQARAAGVPVIGFSNDRTVAQSGTYIFGFLPETDVRHIMDYAVSQGLDPLAALIPDTSYGTRVSETFGQMALRLDATIAGIEIYPPDSSALFDPVRRLANYDERKAAYDAEVKVLQELGDDLSQQLLKTLEPYETIGETGFEAILVPEGGQLLRSLAPLLPFYEIDPKKVQFLGTSLWDDPGLANEPPMRGAWFAAPDPAPVRDFEIRYRSLFDTAPPRLATLGYDAMSLITLLALDPVPNDRFSRRHITDPDGYSGVNGPFRLLPNGLVERNLAIVEITADGLRVRKPAAVGFRFVDRVSSLGSGGR